MLESFRDVRLIDKVPRDSYTVGHILNLHHFRITFNIDNGFIAIFIFIIIDTNNLVFLYLFLLTIPGMDYKILLCVQFTFKINPITEFIQKIKDFLSLTN